MLILQSWSRWISRYINKTTKKLPSNKLLITPSNCVLRSCFCLLTCESNASRSIMINVLSIAYVTNKITYALTTSLGLESVNWHPLGQYYNTKVQVIALLDHSHFYDPSHLVARWASSLHTIPFNNTWVNHQQSAIDQHSIRTWRRVFMWFSPFSVI